MPSGSDELGSTYVRSEPHATRRAAKEAVSRPDRYPAVESHLPNRLKGIAIVTIFAGELICVGPERVRPSVDQAIKSSYNFPAMDVSIVEAKNRLTELIRAVED